jgi:type IV pilus assembly protein PilO
MASPPATGAGPKFGSLGSLSTPVKIAVGVLVPGLLLLAYWIIFYDSITTKIDQAQKQQANLRADLSTQQQAQASYFADRDELALRQQRQREFNKVLPSEADSAAFLSSIQQVSNVSGVQLNAWQPVAESNEAFFARVPMRLEMVGRFHQLAKFAYELGKIDRIINLENIEMSEPKSRGEDTVMKAKFLATAFHTLKAPAPAGGRK